MPKTIHHLTFFERQIIESGLRSGKSVRAIARSLGRDHRVIQREVNRNQPDNRPYTATLSEQLTSKRERDRHRPKLERTENVKLRQFITDKLQEQYSPEQIVGLLKEQAPPALKEAFVCSETIYQYIYQGTGRYEGLFRHLRRGRKKRQQRWARKPRKTKIPERISIHARPEEINARTTIGHWESDTVEGKRKTAGNLSVQYERKTMLARIHKVRDKSAEATEEALRESITSLPQPLWKSITFDNGTEGARHSQLRNDYDIKTYFCDAYASWQKGGVENLNGLIRQYIPKGTDISKLTNQDIYVIQEKLNNRPRKKLNFLTPNQVMANELGGGVGQ